MKTFWSTHVFKTHGLQLATKQNNSYPLSIVSPYDKFLFGSSNIMVKTHHGSNIILMAVSAFFHPIFGSWSFFTAMVNCWSNGPWMRIHWLPFRLVAVSCALQALHVTGSISGAYAEKYEKSQGCWKKLVAPRSVQTFFFVDIIYRNVNTVVWFKWFFLPLQSVVAQKKNSFI